MISELREQKRNKGGRPKKQIKRDEQLAVMCALVERKAIEYKAKTANISVSEFLRTLRLKGQVDMKIKTLPKEVLQFIGMLNHMSANLNQVAKKMNSNEMLNGYDRDALFDVEKFIKQHIENVAKYYQ